VTLTYKGFLVVVCSACGRRDKHLKEETGGLLLVFFIIFFIHLFGINAGSIIGVLMFLFVGSYWLTKRFSKSYICKECVKKRYLELNFKSNKNT
jgi:hypothetical protein